MQSMHPYITRFLIKCIYPHSVIHAVFFTTQVAFDNLFIHSEGAGRELAFHIQSKMFITSKRVSLPLKMPAERFNPCINS